jgi:hypothetical protein
MKTTIFSKSLNFITIFCLVILMVLFVISLKFVIGKLHYYSFHDDSFGRYLGVKWWLVCHISGGILALILGPFQFVAILREKFSRPSKVAEYIYLTGIIISSICSMYLAWKMGFKIHWTWALSSQTLALVWIVTALMTFRALLKKRMQQHKEWMIRSYLVTLVFIAFRWIVFLPAMAKLGNYPQIAPIVMYITLFIPLFIADIIFQWNKN